MKAKQKVALIILDGWGHGDETKSNAIKHANTPFVDSLYHNWPNAELLTDGENVGLPEGQMGNSEVGHLNIGAGRIVYQDLVKINRAIADRSFFDNTELKAAFKHALNKGAKVHLMGLVSRGGVHSAQEHLYALCDMGKEMGLSRLCIHAFTDGRDTDPNSGLGYLTDLEEHLKTSLGEIVSVVGRYYAMDRDKRWERVKLAYDLLTQGKGSAYPNVLEGVEASYAENTTDEFILPIVKVDEQGQPVGRIEENDVVICFNFRTDRCREITMALTQQAFSEYGMQPMNLYYVTMTNYDRTFKNVNVVFDKDNLAATLGQVVAGQGLTQVRIAETEKYPHVTFFFSGGQEKEYEGEKRILINSPKVATYDLKPEMSAYEVTEAICSEMNANQPDFICLNFANPDMVGHTGVYEAVISALQHVDHCAKKVVETGIQNGYAFIIIADHGNADFVINADGSPNTAHTTNPVPVFLINTEYSKINNGVLADVAPTILQLLGVDVPTEMTGKSLL